MSFNNKVLLITGGTGSFGKTVLKKFLNSNFSEIRIFSRDEKKQEDLRLTFNNLKLSFYIGDVRDKHSISLAMRGVDFVFHAAALKQVPSCEFHPMEAVKTNILGTENVLDAAIENQVKKFILLSTDKAVYPVNAMGQTKAIAEKIVLARSMALDREANNKTKLCITRYGNVMGSRGSVIPLFKNQILKGDHITVTDPRMTRFLMSLDESVELVETAFINGEQGDIFVQKSVATTILSLAEAMRRIYKSNVPIKIIGTRHGEKTFESLISREEMLRTSSLGNYFKISPDSRDLNYSSFFTQGDLRISELEDYTSHNADLMDVDQVIYLLNAGNILKDLSD
jgi:UDP-glucose 4-epimerase